MLSLEIVLCFYNTVLLKPVMSNWRNFGWRLASSSSFIASFPRFSSCTCAVKVTASVWERNTRYRYSLFSPLLHKLEFLNWAKTIFTKQHVKQRCKSYNYDIFRMGFTGKIKRFHFRQAAHKVLWQLQTRFLYHHRFTCIVIEKYVCIRTEKIGSSHCTTTQHLITRATRTRFPGTHLQNVKYCTQKTMDICSYIQWLQYVFDLIPSENYCLDKTIVCPWLLASRKDGFSNDRQAGSHDRIKHKIIKRKSFIIAL